MKITLVDTAFAVSLINAGDENHEKAVKLSLEYERQPVLITDCVLLEIGNSLSRSYKTEGSLLIEKFLTTDETEIVRLDEIFSIKHLNFTEITPIKPGV